MDVRSSTAELLWLQDVSCASGPRAVTQSLEGTTAWLSHSLAHVQATASFTE